VPGKSENRIMHRDHSDGIDFKPFFDLVVGLLFILLILISAQLFFSQWAPPDKLQPAKSEAFLWDEEATAFLRDAQNRLNAGGFSTGIDPLRRSVAFQLSDILEGNGTLQAIRADRIASLARMLQETGLCLDPSVVQNTLLSCPGYTQLKRGRVLTTLWLESGNLSGLSPEESARMISLQVISGLINAEPALLKFRGTDAAPYVHITPDSRVRQSQLRWVGGSPAGIVEIRFEFSGKKQQ
jgi:hypothetical protein